MFRSIQKRIFIGYLVITYSLFFLSFFVLYELQTENLLNQAIENSMDLNEIYANEMSDVITVQVEQLELISTTYAQEGNQGVLMSQLETLVKNPYYGFKTKFYVDVSGFRKIFEW